MLDDLGPDDTDLGGEEYLDVGSSWTPPAWVRGIAARFARIPRAAWLAGAAVAAVAVVAGVSGEIIGTGQVVPPAASSPAPTVASTAAAADQGAATLAGIQALVSGRHLLDYVRADASIGDCPLVSVEGAPQRAVAEAVRRDLPGFTVHDFGRTLDEYTEMCILQARAHDSAGTVLVLTIVAPGKHPRRLAYEQITLAGRDEGPVGLTSVTSVSLDGWSVTVGSSGPIRDEPGSEDLLALARDPRLHW